jgi:oxygen-independent coproporphyrinogen-3 oxidase
MNARFASLTPELIEKYSVQGPYYTSYPTGRQWTGDFGAEDFRGGLEGLLKNDSDVPLSLYLHIPFCKRRCRFCFCFAEVTRSREKMDEFLGVLSQEVQLFRRLFDSLGVEPNFREIHLGGGSPSYLEIDQLKTLIEHLRPLVDVGSLDEFTLETDAITVTSDKLLQCRDLGISRLSFGIQDFDERVQRAIGRVQSPELIASLMTPEVRRSFRSINFDLMYGLPFQTRESFGETIARVVDLSPARAAIYSYFHMPEMYPNQSPIQQADLPGTVEKTLIFADAADAFIRNGYEFIGIDHFSRPSDDLARAKSAGTLLRHFMGYTAGRTPHLIGLGPTSISGFGDCYAHNTYSMDEYRQAIHAGKLPLLRGYRMTEDDKIRWTVISRFLAYMSVEFQDIDERFGIDCRSYFADELADIESFVDDGLVEWTDDGFRATAPGVFFARHVCARFDRYAPVDGRAKKNHFVPAIQRGQC